MQVEGKASLEQRGAYWECQAVGLAQGAVSGHQEEVPQGTGDSAVRYGAMEYSGLVENTI